MTKKHIIKVITLNGIIASAQLFGMVTVTNPLPPTPSNAQALHQQYVAQQAQPTPQENQGEYAFKKGLRNLPGIVYYPLMWLFYAPWNGILSEGFKNQIISNVSDTAAPFTLEALDFVGDEIEDKHKDTFEWFFENNARLATIIGCGILSIMNDKTPKAETLQLLNLFDSNLDDFQKGIPSIARNIIKTILLRGVIPLAATIDIKNEKIKMNAGFIFEPFYPLLFDGIVTQLPEDIKNSENKKRLIRATRGLIRAAVRAAIYK